MKSYQKNAFSGFLPKISAGHAWSWKHFFANFQILGPLGCQGWVVIPQNVKKSQNHCTLLYTDKKDNKIFLIYKKLPSGAVAKSYMRKSFVIYEEKRKYFPIYEEAVRHIWLCNCSILNFLIYEENFIFLFYQWNKGGQRHLQRWFYKKYATSGYFYLI